MGNRWRHTLITVFGWSFDLFTVAVSVTDVISDLLVAIQFLEDGHTLWAWLVFGAFINSSVVYSMLLSVIMFDEHNEEFRVGARHILGASPKRVPGLIRFLVLLPLSQLAPCGMYLLQMFVLPYLRQRALGPSTERTRLDDLRNGAAVGYGSASPPDAGGESAQPPGLATVQQEEVDAVKGTYTIVGRLQEAVQRQIITHGMLFAETIVESVPQSIIQLLAITFLGAPSTLQMVSMTLSILSVVSKAYFLSLSACLRAFIFKFAVLSFDVLSMFYIFSSILSSDRPQEVNLFGSDLRVAYLTYAWFIKLAAMAALTILLIAIIILAIVIVEKIRNGRGICDCTITLRTVKWWALGSIAVLLSVIPVVLVQESVKLSWTLMFLLRWEPPLKRVPVASLLYAFLERVADDPDELRERQVHVMVGMEKRFPKLFASYNNIADRVRCVGPILYQYIDLLCDVEEEFLAKYENAYEAEKQCLSQGKPGCDFIRRAYTPLSNLYSRKQHPLGYLWYSKNLYSSANGDRKVSDILQCMITERWDGFALTPDGKAIIGRHSDVRTYQTSTISILAEILRDQEVHVILGEYRDAKKRFVSSGGVLTAASDVIDDEVSVAVPTPAYDGATNADDDHHVVVTTDLTANDNCDVLRGIDPLSNPLLAAGPCRDHGVLERSQLDPPHNPWTDVLRHQTALTPKQWDMILQRDGYKEKVEHWKFERLFHPKRLAYFFDDSVDRDFLIEFVTPSHTAQTLDINPFGYVFWFWFAINAVANCGFSISFMFVTFFTTPQNLLQKFCFWFSIAFLAIAVCMLPGLLRYARLLPSLTTLCMPIGNSTGAVAAVQDVIVSYYDVSSEAVLATTIPHTLLPEDLRVCVASLLGPHGVDKRALTRNECSRIKRQHRGVR